MPSGDNILPLLDRRAPILERVRGDSENNEDELTDLVAKIVSESVKTDDEEVLDETHQSVMENVRKKLANNFGVEPEDISQEYIEQLADTLVSVDEDDVLTGDAIQKLGIKVEDNDEDSGELFD